MFIKNTDAETLEINSIIKFTKSAICLCANSKTPFEDIGGNASIVDISSGDTGIVKEKTTMFPENIPGVNNEIILAWKVFLPRLKTSIWLHQIDKTPLTEILKFEANSEAKLPPPIWYVGGSCQVVKEKDVENIHRDSILEKDDNLFVVCTHLKIVEKSPNNSNFFNEQTRNNK